MKIKPLETFKAVIAFTSLALFTLLLVTLKEIYRLVNASIGLHKAIWFVPRERILKDEPLRAVIERLVTDD